MLLCSIFQLRAEYVAEFGYIIMWPHPCIILLYFYSIFFFADVVCSMKITWYVLVLLVFIFLLILIIRKILEGHRRVQKWQSKYRDINLLDNFSSVKEPLILPID